MGDSGGGGGGLLLGLFLGALAVGSLAGGEGEAKEAARREEERRRRANKLRLRAGGGMATRLLGKGGGDKAVEVVDIESGRVFKLDDLLNRPLPAVENVDDLTYQFTEVGKMVEARRAALAATRRMQEEQELAVELMDLARLKLQVERAELQAKLQDLQERSARARPTRETRPSETTEERRKRQAQDLRQQFENSKEILHGCGFDPESEKELEGVLERDYVEKISALLGARA